MTTLAPSCAKVRAISRPMPPAAPVTTATLSLSCMERVSFLRSARFGVAGRPAGLFAAVPLQVEDHHALVVGRPLQQVRMAQGADRVVVSGAPVGLHAGAREFIVLRVALGRAGPVDQ